MERRLIVKTLLYSTLAPKLLTTALGADYEGENIESTKQCLNRISTGNSFEINNFNKFVYDLRAYDRPAGTITINRERKYLDFDLKVQYPMTPIFVPEIFRMFFGDPRVYYKVHARFEDKDKNTHVQTQRGEKYIYKRQNKGWRLDDFKGLKDEEVDRLRNREIIFPGKPITYWLEDIFFGKNISRIDSFFFGSRYIGEIPFQKLSDEEKSVDVDMNNFWLYEGDEKRSLSADKDVIIGDISAKFKKNVPICAVINILPDVPAIWKRATNLEVVLQS